MKLPHLGRFGRVVLVRIASRFRIIRSEKGWECARIGEFWARESDEYRRGQCAAVNAARLKGHRAHLGSGKGVGNARTRRLETLYTNLEKRRALVSCALPLARTTLSPGRELARFGL